MNGRYKVLAVIRQSCLLIDSKVSAVN